MHKPYYIALADASGGYILIGKTPEHYTEDDMQKDELNLCIYFVESLEFATNFILKHYPAHELHELYAASEDNTFVENNTIDDVLVAVYKRQEPKQSKDIPRYHIIMISCFIIWFVMIVIELIWNLSS